jgi:NTP pyrophosphatase (non-canonical NTP hydrolase)
MIETQASINAWGAKTFGHGTARAIGGRLQKEMDELLAALDVDEHAALDATRDEAADVLIMLYRLAGVGGFNLMAALDRKMRVNRKRKWRSNGDGTGEHVREGE